MVIVTPGSSDAATGSLDEARQLTTTTQSGSAISLTVNGQTLTETLSPLGAASTIGLLGLNANVAPTSRLTNLSIRGNVQTAADIIIAGFGTSGTGTKSILIRGVGPSLAQFGVSGVLPAPELTLFDPASTQIAANSGWGGSSTLSETFGRVGAFALAPTSADAAILQSVGVGSYTAELSGVGGTAGVGLTELYDADAAAPTARLTNLSARGPVGEANGILILGFVIAGNAPETVLLRGIGPSLSLFGLQQVLATPRIDLFDASGTLLDSNATWGGTDALSSVFVQVGAFPLPAGSNDAALLERLPPGAYTVELSGSSGSTGLALVEVYEVN